MKKCCDEFVSQKSELKLIEATLVGIFVEPEAVVELLGPAAVAAAVVAFVAVVAAVVPAVDAAAAAAVAAAVVAAAVALH